MTKNPDKEAWRAIEPHPEDLGTWSKERLELHHSLLAEKIEWAREDGEDDFLVGWYECEANLVSAELTRRNGNGYAHDGFTGNAVLIDASKVKTKKIRWLWHGRIPLGKVTVLDGDPGLGKSLLSIDIAAYLTTGRPMPNSANATLEPAGVVFMSAEDDPEDTIVPRLALAGAELKRVRLLQAVKHEAGLSLPTVRDLDAIKDGIKDVDAKLVIIDPLMAYLPEETNSYRDQDVRRSLAPLAELARETGVAILVIRHLNKSSGNNPVYRGGGSIGIIGAARSGLLVTSDPDDESRCILSASKVNVGKRSVSLAYEILANADEIPWINWLGPTDHTAASLLEEQGKTDEERDAVKEAEEFLGDYLKLMPRKAGDVLKAAHAAGVSEKTLRRAKVRLKVQSQRSEFQGEFFWHLPDSPMMANVPNDGQGESS